MDSNLKRLLKRNYLGVAYLPIHGKGYLKLSNLLCK